MVSLSCRASLRIFEHKSHPRPNIVRASDGQLFSVKEMSYIIQTLWFFYFRNAELESVSVATIMTWATEKLG